MRYLAIDYGLKRTGLAICDPRETIASPLTVFEGQKKLKDKISEIVQLENVEAIVIGLPLNMDGTESDLSRRVRKFGQQLSEDIELDIIFHDERLSSFNAEKKMAGQMTRKRKKKRLDAVAAAEILQSFLEDKKYRQ